MSNYLRFNVNDTLVVYKPGKYVVITAYKKAIPIKDFYEIVKTIRNYKPESEPETQPFPLGDV